MEKRMPLECPSCSTHLHIAQMRCPACDTCVSGDFPLSRLMRLSPQEVEFVEAFVMASGSLKEMARVMGASYPTVRNLLDDIIEKLKKLS